MKPRPAGLAVAVLAAALLAGCSGSDSGAPFAREGCEAFQVAGQSSDDPLASLKATRDVVESEVRPKFASAAKRNDRYADLVSSSGDLTRLIDQYVMLFEAEQYDNADATVDGMWDAMGAIDDACVAILAE